MLIGILRGLPIDGRIICRMGIGEIGWIDVKRIEMAQISSNGEIL
jgi:hypothetical protein